MTHWEILRLACYVIVVPALLYLTLHNGRRRAYAYAAFFGSQTLLFAWYVVEITIASTGVNTREYRVIGTPMIVIMTAAIVVIVGHLRREAI